jgi:hypothetical protein
MRTIPLILRVAALSGVLLSLPCPCGAQQKDSSPAFRAELRKTLEQRRQRRARRESGRPPNAIVPWLMPPTLIIRATPDVQDEVQALLWALRKSR